MDRLIKPEKLILVIIDAALINLSFLLSYFLRFNFNIPAAEINKFVKISFFITVIYITVFYLFKLYNILWSYAGIDEFMWIIAACITSSFASTVFGFIIRNRLPLSICILAGIFSMILTGGLRASIRLIRRHIDLSRRPDCKPKRVLIVGSGRAGTMIVREMRSCKEINYLPAAFIDDDPYKAGREISGLKVVGNRDKIIETVKIMSVDLILIAIAAIDSSTKRDLLNICKGAGCQVKIIPGIYEIIDGQVTLNKIRDVNMEDLLGREPVHLDMDGINDYIRDKVVMVTGGGGSIGSELCRQILKFKPKELVILDNSENNVYILQMDFNRNKVPGNISYVIASVRDKNKLDLVFKKYRPDIVFHAAAHKHVPLMEGNPGEAIKNNIFGTLNTAITADKYKVKRFVMISTDKAVNPTNVMGATKRVCEMIIQSLDKKSETQYVAVRFGNVLGSNGSVVPLFMEQIKNGGPVTVTHKDINRFFMTIPEAAQLVLQAGAYAKGGEIFVLDMESPVKIYDLACDLIRLSGFIPNEDIKIDIIGLRPGEKLYEEVLTDEEGLNRTLHKKIFVGKPTFTDFDKLITEINEFKAIVEGDDREKIIAKLEEIVPTYKRDKRYSAKEETSGNDAAIAKDEPTLMADAI